MEINLIIVCYILPGHSTSTPNISNDGDASVTCEGEEPHHAEAIAAGYKVCTQINVSFTYYIRRRLYWLVNDNLKVMFHLIVN